MFGRVMEELSSTYGIFFFVGLAYDRGWSEAFLFTVTM
jgi:hypothetical protein